MSSSSLPPFILIGALILSLTGCQQAQDPPASTAGASSVHGSQANAEEQAPHRLIGQWQGALEIDQPAVTKLFQDAGREDQLETALDAYRNMEMTMGFEEDGKMTMSIKIDKDESPEQGSGTWELIRDEGNLSIVKSKEEGSGEQEIEIAFKDPDHFQMLPKGPFRNAAVIKFSRIR